MNNFRKRIDQRRRSLDDLIVEVLAKAKLDDHYPTFEKADKFRKCAEFLQKASAELFMANVAIMEVDDD